MHLEPSDENIVRFLGRGVEGPLSMLNLLCFRDVADYAADPQLAPAEPISGEEAYDTSRSGSGVY